MYLWRAVLRRANPIGHLLEVDRFPVIVEATRTLFALKDIQNAGVGGAVGALPDSDRRHKANNTAQS